METRGGGGEITSGLNPGLGRERTSGRDGGGGCVLGGRLSLEGRGGSVGDETAPGLGNDRGFIIGGGEGSRSGGGGGDEGSGGGGGGGGDLGSGGGGLDALGFGGRTLGGGLSIAMGGGGDGNRSSRSGMGGGADLTGLFIAGLGCGGGVESFFSAGLGFGLGRTEGAGESPSDVGFLSAGFGFGAGGGRFSVPDVASTVPAVFFNWTPNGFGFVSVTSSPTLPREPPPTGLSDIFLNSGVVARLSRDGTPTRSSDAVFFIHGGVDAVESVASTEGGRCPSPLLTFFN